MIRRHVTGDAEPSTPRPAATVALVRDASDGIEVLLLRRSATMQFAASQSVFPGGGVDPQDRLLVDFVPPEERTWWSERLGCDPTTACALVGAAVRETFEETGVLLARSRERSAPVDADTAEMDRLRRQLEGKQLTFAHVLTRLDARVDSRALRPWSRWVTPVWSARRYDTLVLVAAIPAGHTVRADSSESVSATWVTPADAVSQHGRGELAMLTPTIETLRELDGVPSPWARAAGERDLTAAEFDIDVEGAEVRVVARTPRGTLAVHAFRRNW